MTASYPDAQSPGSQVGPLTLIQAIAQGGEGIVYTARHDTLGDVVVKEFWPKQIVSRARDVSARAAQENWQLAYRDGVAQFIRLGKRLIDLPRHPGLMVALEVFEANNTAYLVTERVEGRTLDTALEAGAFSDPDDIRRLAERLGDAMAHLHRQGLFHRDLAPDNIIITAGFDWHPVLIDFNAAKDIVQKVSRSHDGIVKPGFTAIEQYAIDGKEPIGAWTDIFSASAVLYRCITGEAPADPAVRLLRPSQSPQLTDSHANRFDPAFLRGVEAGLEPHPDNRPQTVAAWLAAMGLTGAEPDVEPGEADHPTAPDLYPSADLEPKSLLSPDQPVLEWVDAHGTIGSDVPQNSNAVAKLVIGLGIALALVFIASFLPRPSRLDPVNESTPLLTSCDDGEQSNCSPAEKDETSTGEPLGKAQAIDEASSNQEDSTLPDSTEPKMPAPAATEEPPIQRKMEGLAGSCRRIGDIVVVEVSGTATGNVEAAIMGRDKMMFDQYTSGGTEESMECGSWSSEGKSSCRRKRGDPHRTVFSWRNRVPLFGARHYDKNGALWDPKTSRNPFFDRVSIDLFDGKGGDTVSSQLEISCNVFVG
ncbi:MAG: serine/threonine-protein kinase [Novosphingobium sp.]